MAAEGTVRAHLLVEFIGPKPFLQTPIFFFFFSTGPRPNVTQFGQIFDNFLAVFLTIFDNVLSCFFNSLKFFKTTFWPFLWQFFFWIFSQTNVKVLEFMAFFCHFKTIFWNSHKAFNFSLNYSVLVSPKKCVSTRVFWLRFCARDGFDVQMDALL
jgi:hypothetical protein